MTEFSLSADGDSTSRPLTEWSESEALIAAARELDEEAWEDIYTASYDKIYRYVYARVSDAATAEDLASAVFTEAVKRIGSYSDRGRPILAWLYGIARNLTNEYHRTAIRRREIAPEQRISSDAEMSVADEGASPERRIDRWDLQGAMLKLSEDQREVLLLRFFVGLTTPEVALLVKKKERAVYSLYTRAIKSLRRHLGESD